MYFKLLYYTKNRVSPTISLAAYDLLIDILLSLYYDFL